MQAEANLDQTVLDIIDARVGTVIRNKWRVDALLGTGGMAAVYAATHRNGNRVALKVLHLQLSIDQSLCQRFKREGYAANSVQHPGVVRVLDDDVTEDGAAFLVMELLDGETAADRAERLGGRLPIQDVMPIIDGVLDVLDTAHAGGIVHRDIKPENIFFTRDRRVKLFDFGIARLRDGGSASHLSHTASAMGTPAFMPPEQALGHMDKVDALSDVWATGATMYTLLSGHLVHEYDTANEVLIAAATRSAASLGTVAPDVPPEIVEIVDRALSYEKKGRWSSAKAMQHALRNAVDSLASSWGRISLVEPAEASGSHPRVLMPRESATEIVPQSAALFRPPTPAGGLRPGPNRPASPDTTAPSTEKPHPSAANSSSFKAAIDPEAAPDEAARRRSGLHRAKVAAIWAVFLVLVALCGMVFLAMGRVAGPQPKVTSSVPLAVPSPTAAEPPRPHPADLELTNADLPPASASPEAAPGAGGLDDPGKPATKAPRARTRKPSDSKAAPAEPPREKSWLDRRK
ncbi:protein kinase domain-containing protein [Pendulispora albinea]|uniref:Protein kinase n=1 Tax=Pendulispora albinea TaxID=2741071 RepID=A0ABZ2M820_9BACT